MTVQPALQLPGGLTPADFLSRCWQKRPLFLADAVPGFRPPLTVDELAGLACEPEVESRLVFTERQGGTVRYRAETGPFEADYLAALPPSDWTLLVHDLDRHLPELRSLLLAPRFLPTWRMGDLMASVAAPGGSVGPHRDSYDVFLLQGEGRRRWQLGSGQPARATSGLRLLADFRAEEEFVCGPGDALYVPPGAGHHGVAETLCTTWSLGLQAPLVRDLALYLDLDARKIEPDRRYADPDLAPAECRGGVIHPAAVRRCRAALSDAAGVDDDDIAEALGRLVTLPKPGHRPQPATPAETAAIVTAAAGGRALRAAPSACFRGSGGPVLCAAGESFPVPEAAWPLACRLAGAEGAEGLAISPPPDEAGERLLSLLARHGLLEALPG
ncbi:cupin domain-containing protein [Lentisalinibacter sediminis]|uniref:cupin domain-containing protein n=1 Tax=Lentisalinibacter sediminis TaxID=2992237 RepID=UPI0038641C8E